MNEYKPQKIISFAPRQIVVRVSDSICDIWTSSNVYVILAQNSVRSHQSYEIDIAFMPDSDNYGGISPVSPNQVPPPFHQADACKILDCPGGRGRTKWLPGVRLSLVPGSFALNIEALPSEQLFGTPIRLSSPAVNPRLEIAVVSNTLHDLLKGFLADLLAEPSTYPLLQHTRRWDWTAEISEAPVY